MSSQQTSLRPTEDPPGQQDNYSEIDINSVE